MEISKAEIMERVIEDVYDVGIRKTDEYKNLECFCSDNPPQNEFERKIRGYVYHNDKLILKSICYSIDFENIKDQKEEVEKIKDISNYDITIMKEGTCIRVFYYNDQWFVTTHRKLDAFKSKWGKVSFGDLFEKNIKTKTNLSLSDFLDTLNKNISYVFIVGTNDYTRFVSPVYSDVRIICCMDSNGKFIDKESDEVSVELKPWFLEKLKFNNISEIISYVENNFKTPFDNGYGLFLQYKTNNDENYRFINDTYRELSLLRNNLPSVMYAYLHNIFDEEKKNRFIDLYKKFKDDFEYYDNEIKVIAVELLHKYTKKYIHKNNIEYEKHEQNILYNIHKIFLKYKSENLKYVINIDDVYETLKIIPPSNINKIINSRKRELLRKQKEEEKESAVISSDYSTPSECSE